MNNFSKRILRYFHYNTNGYLLRNKKRSVYLKGVRDCLEYIENRAWNIITDDTDSYPECYRCVLIEDDEGDNNIAYCDANCDWYISNGESTLKLIGEVVKWAEID